VSSLRALLLLLPVAALGCATGDAGDDPTSVNQEEAGTVPATDSGYGSRADSSSPYTSDSGARPDAGAKDAGDVDSSHPPDSGAKDSGGGGGGGGIRTDLCSGERSSQVTEWFGFVHVEYEDCCDSYYSNTAGMGKPCGPSGASCAAFNGTDGYATYCCYVPQPGEGCYDDYRGTAQCVPQ
jgi:hypothetical protein